MQALCPMRALGRWRPNRVRPERFVAGDPLPSAPGRQGPKALLSARSARAGAAPEANRLAAPRPGKGKGIEARAESPAVKTGEVHGRGLSARAMSGPPFCPTFTSSGACTTVRINTLKVGRGVPRRFLDVLWDGPAKEPDDAPCQPGLVKGAATAGLPWLVPVLPQYTVRMYR